MLTQLSLLMLEDKAADEIEKLLPQNEAENVTAWYDDQKNALPAFLYCAGYSKKEYPLTDTQKSEYKKLLTKPAKTEKRERKGRFIVLEGVDGAGKTTHIELLRKNLLCEGKNVYPTAEPTPSAAGGLVRDALAGLHIRSASELAALFLADRIQHNVNPKNGIRGFLEAGVDVICDRYYYSSLAYQGIDSDIDWVSDMNLNCPDICRPDACIFLDLPVERCIERMSKDRLTSEIFETEEIIRKVKRRFADTFRALNERENIFIVNADRKKEEVSADIYDIVKGIK